MQAQIRRVQSAKKSIVSYKEQYNFLFKEDIFDANYEKNKNNLPFRELGGNNLKLSEKLR